MSILDMFRTAPITSPAPVAPVAPAPVPGTTPTPGTAPGQPGNIPAPQPGAPAEQGVIPAPEPVAPVEPVVPDSPLAPFEKLWDTPPIDPNAPAPTEIPELKAEDVQKIMANANFTPQITDEQRAAIVAGGEGATEAFNAALNSVAQQVMTQATLVGNKLTEKQVAAAIEKHMSNLPELLRNQGSTEHLRTTDPLFENPAVKPIIDITQQQLLQKFPNASLAEITQMTRDFILAMGESFSPPVDTSVPGETDWGKFLEK